MSRSAHWLSAIDLVLRARTRNLRALARIAGGDPTTFYIGTKLNNADICGQDLRGMHFADTDFSTVKMDEKTLLDAPSNQEELEASEPIWGLLLAVTKSKRSAAADDFAGLRIYRAIDAYVFWNDAAGFNGPKFVVVEAPSADDYNELARTLGDPSLYVIILGANIDVVRLLRDMHEQPRATCILLPQGKSPANRRESLPPSAVRLVFRIIQNPDAFRALSVFAYYSGEKWYETSDEGWANLFEISAAAGMLRYPSVRISFEGGLVAEALFPDSPSLLRKLSPLATTSLPSTGVIFDLSVRPELGPDSYAEGVARLLVSLNWRVEIEQENEFVIRGPREREFRVEVYGQGRRPESKLVDRRHKSEQRPLIRVLENPSWDEVIGNLGVGVFDIRMRDLLLLDAHRASEWQLLKAQLRRLVRTTDARVRKAYLRVLISDSIARQRVVGGATLIHQLFVEGRIFETGFTVSAQTVTCNSEYAEFLIKIGRNSTGEVQPIAEFVIFFDQAGARTEVMPIQELRA